MWRPRIDHGVPEAPISLIVKHLKENLNAVRLHDRNLSSEKQLGLHCQASQEEQLWFQQWVQLCAPKACIDCCAHFCLSVVPEVGNASSSCQSVVNVLLRQFIRAVSEEFNFIRSASIPCYSTVLKF